MNEGILFRSAKFKNETGGDERQFQFAIICGQLTDDPKVEFFKNAKVSFNLKYHTKSFLNVVAWGDSEASFSARALEKGDQVLCAGLIISKPYVVKQGEHKGEKREWVEMSPVWIHAQAWDNFLLDLYSTPKIMEMVEEARAADVMESANDAVDEYVPSI